MIEQKLFIKKQRGVSLLSLVFGLGLIIVFTSMFVNVAPIYAENYSVETGLKSMAEDPNTRKLSNREIKNKLMKRLGISGVSNVKDRDIIINRSANSMVLQIAYEVRTDFLANIDFVLTFDDKEEVVR